MGGHCQRVDEGSLRHSRIVGLLRAAFRDTRSLALFERRSVPLMFFGVVKSSQPRMALPFLAQSGRCPRVGGCPLWGYSGSGTSRPSGLLVTHKRHGLLKVLCKPTPSEPAICLARSESQQSKSCPHFRHCACGRKQCGATPTSSWKRVAENSPLTHVT